MGCREGKQGGWGGREGEGLTEGGQAHTCGMSSTTQQQHSIFNSNKQYIFNNNKASKANEGEGFGFLV